MIQALGHSSYSAHGTRHTAHGKGGEWTLYGEELGRALILKRPFRFFPEFTKGCATWFSGFSTNIIAITTDACSYSERKNRLRYAFALWFIARPSIFSVQVEPISNFILLSVSKTMGFISALGLFVSRVFSPTWRT